MATEPKTFLTPEQYLEIERKAEYKSEYYAGEMFAMAGAQEPHNLITTNVIVSLGLQVRGRACRVYGSDMRVKVSQSGLYTYPDVSAVYGERQLEDTGLDTLLNATLIVEVLSPTTEVRDRGRKFRDYRTIASLRQYVMIASELVEVELYTRDDKGDWVLTLASQPEDVVQLASIDCSLRLTDVCDKTDLLPSAI